MAVLLLFGVAPSQAAVGSLLFNVFATSSSILRWRFCISRDLLWFLVGSIPAAFLGGLLQALEELMKTAMGFVIIGGGISATISVKPAVKLRIDIPIMILVGVGVGLLAGLTGIGGGVYLAPILLLSGVTEPKTAATTTILTLLNSSEVLLNPMILLTIPITVLVAQLGSYLGSIKLKQRDVKRINRDIHNTPLGKLLESLVIETFMKGNLTYP